jgi:hypothetical protein
LALRVIFLTGKAFDLDDAVALGDADREFMEKILAGIGFMRMQARDFCLQLLPIGRELRFSGEAALEPREFVLESLEAVERLRRRCAIAEGGEIDDRRSIASNCRGIGMTGAIT